MWNEADMCWCCHQETWSFIQVLASTIAFIRVQCHVILDVSYYRFSKNFLQWSVSDFENVSFPVF